MKAKNSKLYVLIVILAIIVSIFVIYWDVIDLNTAFHPHYSNFNDSNIQYMLNDINESYGKGEELIEVYGSRATRSITNESNKIIGSEITIRGYFPSQDRIWSMVYSKYDVDYIIKGKKDCCYKDKINYVAVSNNVSKDEWFKSHPNDEK